MLANISGRVKLFQTQIPSLVNLVLKAVGALFVGLIVMTVAEKTGWFDARKGMSAIMYGVAGFLAGGVYGLRAGWCKSQPEWQISALEKARFALGYLSGFILAGCFAALAWLGV